MRTVFSLGLLILPASMAAATDQAASESVADLAVLVRNHGFVKPSLVQNADEATVGEIAAAAEAVAEEAPAAPVAEAVAEPSIAPVPMADDAMPAGEGEVGYAAPIRNPHYHYSAPQRRSSRGGVFSELIELERRKNAWLKRTFFGR